MNKTFFCNVNICRDLSDGLEKPFTTFQGELDALVQQERYFNVSEIQMVLYCPPSRSFFGCKLYHIHGRAGQLSSEYCWRSIPAYIGAAFVGWSKVEGESDKHDATDVLAGASIGILSSYYFTTLYNKGYCNSNCR